ncbi:PqqD family protein [Puniceicoccus vermicola]|uniref:PqqD family protein n=1 Tax=Puniceicoccus vermicola TaxID=388746 RepID=A0A7X1AYW6_9BACT|nr:PqqD family protein [Puniceicoccus vermicola]MBC2602536.1 PqqD family protein [Puniceicoccus vermicola]
MILSRHQKKKQIPPAPEDRAHPLEAVPIRHESVEERISSTGDLHLHAVVPPTTFVERAMAKVTKTGKSIQVALDERGAFFWRQIDGRNDLFAIRRALRNKYNLSASDSEDATVRFTKMLMRRNLIQLKVHPKRNQAS